MSHINKLEALKSFQLFNELISFPKIELDIEENVFSNFYSLIGQIVSEYKLKDEYSISITRSTLHILITKLFRIKFNHGQLPNKKKYLTEFLSLQEMVEKNCFTNNSLKTRLF